MLKIINSNIELTRGDTAHIPIETDYEFQQNDVVKFSVKADFEDTAYKIQKKITYFDGNIVTIHLTPQDTRLSPGVYVYDCQLNNSMGEVDTFLSGTFTILQEVTKDD